MTAVATSTTAIITLADLLEQLGDIAPARVRFRPAPGTATEQDVLAIHDHEDRLYELVDRVLVEKAMGFRESLLAGMLIEILRGFVRARNLGLVTAPDGMMRLAAGLVRIPDVAFIAWDRFPNRRVPTRAHSRCGSQSGSGSVERRQYSRGNGPQAPGLFCRRGAGRLAGRPARAYRAGIYDP
jgi:hypothetical protein